MPKTSLVSMILKFFHNRALSNGISGSLIFSSLYIVQLISGWWLVQASGLDGPISQSGDLLQIIHLAEQCSNELMGIEVNKWILTYWSQCGGFLYGTPLYLAIAGVSFSPALTVAGGIFLGFLTSAIVGFFSFEVMQDLGLAAKAFAAAMFFSPGVVLLFERANLDLVILLLVFCSCAIANRRNTVLALLPLWVASLMKFYTLPLFAFLVFVSWRESRPRFILASGLLLAAASVAVLDMARIPEFHQVGFNQFGLTVWVHYFDWLELSPSRLLAYAVGVSLPLVAFFTLSRLRFNNLREFHLGRLDGGWQRSLEIYCSIIFVSCYFAGLSFDYRLIFLAIPAILIIHRIRHLSSRLFTFIVVLLALALWGSTSLGVGLKPENSEFWFFAVAAFQVIGDASVGLWVGMLLWNLKMRVDWKKSPSIQSLHSL